MSDVAIRVEGLGKQYRIGGPQARYKTLRESLAGAAQAPIRRAGRLLRGEAATDHQETIWALKDVSFEVKHGEVLGIIGRNGAGKSTLLKILSRITAPTEGIVDLYGRVGSLLEVGTGFHPELTGRENIYLSGAILGMKRAEIDRKFDEMVAFAEIEKFLDTPAKHYSSGMYVRLAFAVAAHLDPEILLVDEVLAVGDAAFQKKCLGKMGEVAGEGRTVLFVSHNMGMIRQLCQQGVLLSEGRALAKGASSSVISTYLHSVEVPEGSHFMADAKPEMPLQILEASTPCQSDGACSQFDIAESPIIDVKYAVRERLVGSAISLKIVKDGTVLCTSFDTDDMEHLLEARSPGCYKVRIIIPPGLLKPGHYAVDLGAGVLNQRRIDYVEKALAFDVGAVSVGDSLKSFSARREGLIAIPMTWRLLETV